jgi:vacuolar protein sorting-associated protein 13A/C
MEQALFTWEDPRGQKKLAWNGMNASNKKEEVVNQLRKDGIGKLWVSKGSENDPDVYWVSFLDGMQRVLLFTSNPDVAREAQTAADLEPISMELTMSLEGIGLSLVSEIEKRVVELLYMRMAR